jgi:glycosyltransferase involved in cell wall biosynthesis
MVSVIVTVKNEEHSIYQLLQSLDYQSLKPDEVIIVDGGSEDGTVDIIKAFMASRSSFELIIANGSSRSEGRNIGILAARSDIIAVTDAGVVLNRSWLENLIKPFEDKSADVVGGVYVQGGDSLLQKSIGILQYPDIKKLRVTDFLPSCRSIAFSKKVWEGAGGFPKHLERAEDTYFDLMVIKKGFRIALAKDAIASFPARNSIKDLFTQYSSYAEWDARARLLSRLKIYKIMIIAYVVMIFLLALIVMFGLIGFLFSIAVVLAYLVFNGIKVLIKTKRPMSFFYGAAIKVTVLIAETYGLLKGLFNRKQSKTQDCHPTGHY